MGEMTFEKTVQRIYDLPLYTKKNTVQDTQKFLAAMQHPDLDMKIIHIAGTNGKGSTCAYLSNLLQKAGYNVGMFTSPHLVDIRERMQINGSMISKESFLDAVHVIDSLLEQNEYQASYFEYLFFVAMYFFRKEKVDFLVLETGLGGRLDATNAIDKKVLTIITKIALDHTQILGESIDKIAFEKAGILKEAVPLVFLEQEECVNTIVTNRALELHAPIKKVHILEDNEILTRDKSVAFFWSYQYDKEEFLLNTPAIYQVDNARLACVALETLFEVGAISRKLDISDVKKVLYDTKWSGRMEEILPGYFLDGAHNLNGVYAFIQSAESISCGGKRILIFSAVDDKDYKKMLNSLIDCGLFEIIIITQVDNKRKVQSSVLKDVIIQSKTNIKVHQTDYLVEAIERAKKEKDTQDQIYIAGSLYLVGEAKSHLNAERNRCSYD